MLVYHIKLKAVGLSSSPHNRFDTIQLTPNAKPLGGTLKHPSNSIKCEYSCSENICISLNMKFTLLFSTYPRQAED